MLSVLMFAYVVDVEFDFKEYQPWVLQVDNKKGKRTRKGKRFKRMIP